jgi:dipeptidyl aminopeptidase/acylaminoacyl peptidase
MAKHIKSPTLLIHGMKDELISYDHSKEIFEVLKKCKCRSELILPEDMTHNGFEFYRDLIRHLIDFVDINCFKKDGGSFIGQVTLSN